MLRWDRSPCKLFLCIQAQYFAYFELEAMLQWARAPPWERHWCIQAWHVTLIQALQSRYAEYIPNQQHRLFVNLQFLLNSEAIPWHMHACCYSWWDTWLIQLLPYASAGAAAAHRSAAIMQCYQSTHLDRKRLVLLVHSRHAMVAAYYSRVQAHVMLLI